MPDEELVPEGNVALPPAPELPERTAFIGVKFTADQQYYLQFLSRRLGVSEGEAVRMLVEACRTLAAISPAAASKHEQSGAYAEGREGRPAKREGADIRVVWIALAFLLGVALAVAYLLLKGTR